jgi:hypothetical protein
MSDKKFSPKEAALMVLAKAQELAKASTLAKGDWAKIHSKLKREGYSEESADKIDGAIKAKMGKSEEAQANPDAQADAQLGEKVEQDVQQHEAQNSDPASHEAPMKGHIKLAKFVGRMEHKKGQKAKELDKGETGHEKGVAPQAPAAPAGMSTAGQKIGVGSALPEAKPAMEASAKKASIGRMMEQSAIKPKLPV